MIEPREQIVPAALITMALLGALAHYFFGFSHWDLSGHAYGSDDAFISFRYARNFVDGHGLVFNPGERVEGYTNLLYTLFAAAIIYANPAWVLPGCFVINLLALVGTLLLSYWYLQQTSSPARAHIGLLLLCASPIMWAWPASGLESSCVLFTQLALFVTADLASRHNSIKLSAIYGCLATLSILLRADGFVFASIATGIFLLRGKYRAFFLALAFIVTLTLAHFLIRHAYYGDFLPNTYFAKISGTLGQRLESAGKQLRDLIKKDALYLPILALLIGIYQWIKAWRHRRAFSLLDIPLPPYVILALLVYWFYIGGDVYFERFILVLLPLSTIYVLGLIKNKLIWPAVVCILSLQVIVPFKKEARFDYHIGRYDRWVELGTFLSTQPQYKTLAIDAAGKVPYYSRLTTLDMLGLNDRHIGRTPTAFFKVGHNKFDPDYVLARQPDLIAAWGSDQLDLSWGMTRDKFRAHGYNIRYVVNSDVRSKSPNIIDVSGYNDEQILALWNAGYRYFVLAREVKAAGTVIDVR